MSEFSDTLAELRAEWERINRWQLNNRPSIKHKTMPSTRTRGWDRAFEEMEDDDAAEQAWAIGLGFRDATDYHDQTGIADDMDTLYERCEDDWWENRP